MINGNNCFDVIRFYTEIDIKTSPIRNAEVGWLVKSKTLTHGNNVQNPNFCRNNLGFLTSNAPIHGIWV